MYVYPARACVHVYYTCLRVHVSYLLLVGVLLLAFLQLSLRLLQLCIQLVGFNLLRLLQTPESEQNFTHTPYNYVRTQLCIYACMSSSSQNLFPIHTHILPYTLGDKFKTIFKTFSLWIITLKYMYIQSIVVCFIIVCPFIGISSHRY